MSSTQSTHGKQHLLVLLVLLYLPVCDDIDIDYVIDIKIQLSIRKKQILETDSQLSVLHGFNQNFKMFFFSF